MARITRAMQQSTPSETGDGWLLTADDYRRGYAKLPNEMGDDAVPLTFHQDVTVDGERGFLQRGNLLDRY